MDRSAKPIIHHWPNACYEAAMLVFTKGDGRMANLTKNHREFGMTKQEAEAYYGAYLAFEKAALLEIQPLLEGQEALMPYLTLSLGTTEVKSCYTLGVLLSLMDSRWQEEPPSRALVDDLMARILTSLLFEGEDAPDIQDLGAIDAIGLIYGQAYLSDSQKLTLIRFYADRHRAIPALCRLLTSLGQGIQKHFHLLSSACAPLLSQLEGEGCLATLLSGLQINTTLPMERMHVYPSYVAFNGCSFHITLRHCALHIGLYYFDLEKRHDENATKYLSDLKAIADPTRYEILRLLCREPLHVGELARRLALTSATVSYHLGTLMAERLVGIIDDQARQRGARYYASARQLRQIANRLQKLAKEAEHGYNGKKESE